MSVEFFNGFDASEGMDASSFEKFQEKWKQASAQIAAIKKEEKKQKKKEDELIQILLKFIKSSNNKKLTYLISKNLEKNIPAHFILTIISLVFTEIEKSLSIASLEKDEKAITFFAEQKTFSLEEKIKLDTWLKNIIKSAEECAKKLSNNCWIQDNPEEKNTILALEDLFTYILMAFFKQNKIELDQNNTIKGAKLLIKNILIKSEEDFKTRKQIN